MNAPIRPLALCCLLALAPLSALATDPAPLPPPPPGGPGAMHRAPPSPEAMTERLTRELGLDEAQKRKVLELNEQHVAAMKALRPTDEEIRARHEQARALREQHHAALRAVLTPEQAAKLDERRNAHEGRLRGHRGPPPPP